MYKKLLLNDQSLSMKSRER